MGKRRGNREVSKTVEPIKEEVVAPVEEVIEEPKEEVTKEVDAIVDGVDMYLNIRNKPEVKEETKIGIVKKGYKIVVVDPEKPIKGKDEVWVKVKFGNPPQEGYAMKKYIRVI